MKISKCIAAVITLSLLVSNSACLAKSDNTQDVLTEHVQQKDVQQNLEAEESSSQALENLGIQSEWDELVKNVQSFENGVPKNWVSEKTALKTSGKHYKLHLNSLQWDFEPNEKLTATEVFNMEEASQSSKGGLIMWIYNETPIDDTITVNLGTKEQIANNNVPYTFDFIMNYKGWRAAWIYFKDDAINKDYTGKSKSIIEQMEIIAPNTSGTLYFDTVDFLSDNKCFKNRATDYQDPTKGGDSNSKWVSAYRYSQLKPTIPLGTKTYADQFDIIEKRLDDWVFGTGNYLDEQPMKIRLNMLDEYIKSGLEQYDTLNLTRNSDGSIKGVPLYAGRSPYIEELRKFESTGAGVATDRRQFSRDIGGRVFIPLVFDYKINGNKESLQKLFNLLDHFYDQGWAEGSGIGSLDHEGNRMAGYVYAVYLIRKELEETGRFKDHVDAMNWFVEFGKVYGEYGTDYVETTADEMMTHFMYRLMSVLVMEDSPEKVQAMQSYVNWVNNAFIPRRDNFGGVKPDSTIFHHKGIYINAYGSSGLHLASVITYLLSDTVFEVNKETHTNIKNAIITFDIMTNKEEVPINLIGRYPHKNSYGAEGQGAIGNLVMPMYAYMALAGDPETGEDIDKEMAGIFVKSWIPNDENLQRQQFAIANPGKSYVHTPGAIETMLDVVNLGISATPEHNGFWSYPYAGLAVLRQDNWMTLVKGFGKYVHDFESSDTENLYGRYIGYGSMPIIATSADALGSPVTLKYSGFDYINGFDWNRIQGATTKYLPMDKLLKTEENNKHRNFSDQTFLGAVDANNEGVWGVLLHDNTFDKSFYANKSVFFFDDVIVRLGSDIRCDDKNNPIQTTLFQNNLNGDKSMPMYINSDNKITDFPYKCTDDNITWIIDPYNNGYYIPNSSELNIYRDTQHSRDGGNKIDTSGEYATAYLDHGKAPKSASYEYAIKVQTTPQEMAHFSKNPTYKVLQQDSIAHIVKNNISNAVGYAIFDADKYSGKDFILSADTPVLAMVKENDAKNVSLYLSDPDLRLPYIEDLDELNSGEERPSTMKVATIKINGEWEIDGASEGVKIVKSKDGKTTLAFDCIDGLTISVNLKVK
jgi:hypothetical protein